MEGRAVGTPALITLTVPALWRVPVSVGARALPVLVRRTGDQLIVRPLR